jgi:hypothetical protein
MTKELYRYVFTPDAPIEEVEASLLLAILATESLHGESQVRLDAAHFFDPAKRGCAIDASTPVGRDLNRLFIGFISVRCRKRADTGEITNEIKGYCKKDQLPPATGAAPATNSTPPWKRS